MQKRQRRASVSPLDRGGVASRDAGVASQARAEPRGGVATDIVGAASGITDRSLAKGRGQNRKPRGVVTCGLAAEEGAAAAAVRGAAGPLRSRGAMRRS